MGVAILAMLKQASSSKYASAITPAGRLAQTMRVGAPKVSSPPRPSIHQIAKPPGIGRPLPGTKKTTI